jgi:hypothetical protein
MCKDGEYTETAWRTRGFFYGSRGQPTIEEGADSSVLGSGFSSILTVLASGRFSGNHFRRFPTHSLRGF